MSDVIRILDIARRALQAHQSAMNIASNNIANVNTDGYSRQRVNLSSARGIITPQGILGAGVNVGSVERIRDKFIDDQLTQERPFLQQYQFKSDALQFLEQVFNEPSDLGLVKNMEDFFDAFSDLANDPENSATRTAVREKGITLANGFNRIHRQLSDYQQKVNSELSRGVDEVNQLTEQIASLNKQIVDAEVGGNQAPTLRDSRDLLIDKLSELVDVRTSESDNGAINVSVAGRFVVVSGEAHKLQAKIQNAGDNGPTIVFENGGQVAKISNGKIKGMLDVRDKNIPAYLDELDQLAVGFAEGVNELHSGGFNLDGTTGINFFDPGVSGAGNIRVDTAILNDANLIAAAGVAGEPGNNAVALAISDLRNAPSMNQGQFTFGDFYGSLLSTVGAQTQEAEFLKSSYELTVEKLELTRESVSGVSLDEEMTNLIEAQQAFTAASRVVTTIDEMTNTILNMI